MALDFGGFLSQTCFPPQKLIFGWWWLSEGHCIVSLLGQVCQEEVGDFECGTETEAEWSGREIAEYGDTWTWKNAMEVTPHIHVTAKR